MKVLFINVDCGVGSTGRICSNLARYLISMGHEAIVAYGRGCSETDKDISYRIGNPFDVRLHAFFSRLFDRSGFFSKQSTKRFIKWIDSYKPDIINIHNLHGYYIDVKSLLSYISQKQYRVYFTLHDCWLFTGHCAYFSFISCDKWIKEGCNCCPQKKTYPKSIVFDSSSRNYNDKKRLLSSLAKPVFITPSDWLSNLARLSFLSNNKIVTIHNGIDVKVFKKSHNKSLLDKLNIIGKRIILGVASPWSPRKGFEDFLKLASIISTDYVIVMIGLSKKQLAQLPSNVIGFEKTDSIEMLVELYSCAYVLFNPTREDNYPTTNLEAQACGCPVITYNTGGSVESVPTRQVVEPGDIGKVYELIEQGNLKLFDNSSFGYEKMSEEYLSMFLSKD